jgi:hypothetical protein
MAVYFLKHPRPDFTGVMGGVDFYLGQGSTSSLQDARALKDKGCVILDEQHRPVEITATRHPEAHVEILTAKASGPAPVIETNKGEGVPAGAPSPSLSADTAALKAQEDNPDSPEQKALAAKVDQAKKRGNRRRK